MLRLTLKLHGDGVEGTLAESSVLLEKKRASKLAVVSE